MHVISTSLLEQATKRERQLSLIVEIDRFLLTTRNLNRQTCQPLLQLVAELAEADRVFILEKEPAQNSQAAATFIAEWRRETVQPSRLLSQHIEDSQALERIQRLLESGEVMMSRVADLSSAEQALFGQSGAQALLLLPIIVKGKFYGLLGCERHGSPLLWESDCLNLLKAAASSVSIALERKYIEQELMEAKEQFQAVLDAVPGFVSWVSADMTYLGLNRHLAAALGGKPEDFVGKKVGFLNSKFYNFLKGLFESPYQASVMEDTITIAGRQMQHLVFAQKYHQGQAAVCVGIDITDRKIMEERLREQAKLLEVTRDAVILQDLQGKVLYWNPGAVRLYGWTEEEVLGRSIRAELYDEADLAQIEAVHQKVLQTGQWIGELRQRTKSGKKVIVESRRTLVLNEKGEPDKVLVVNTDITEKKDLESQMLRNQRMDSIGLLASGIAHDMNNVLAPILTGLLLLRKQNPDEQSRRWIALLEESAIRGKELIKQILSFARGNSGEKTVFNPSHIVKDVARFISQTFPKEIEIECEAPATIWSIFGEPTQLHQVLLNLCVNARDAMPNGGRLTIRAENVVLDAAKAAAFVDAEEGEYVCLTVSDTGTGIAPDILDKIFEPFFTTKEVGKGTGLGLSVVFSVVRSHNGFIDVKTKVGSGTSFFIYLPATKTEQKEFGEESMEAMQGSGEVILLVEDDVAVREVAHAILLSMGYTVLTANNGAEAVAIFAQHSSEINLLLTDIMMPVMDGIACVHAIRSLRPDLPVVVMSGLMEGEKVAKLSSLGVQGSITKPFRAEALLQTVYRALKQTTVRY
ncbi:MAG: PAS domain S-box protein [Chloroherpetonaceae bacterium]|nr:PAS domain S-box protein [Chloroherpetonaceae bacterium]MDW8020762.1 PAS domain S-box protein [Chloroherpetonaceae bacterium]